jgi:hypothetical protein
MTSPEVSVPLARQRVGKFSFSSMDVISLALWALVGWQMLVEVPLYANLFDRLGLKTTALFHGFRTLPLFVVPMMVFATIVAAKVWNYSYFRGTVLIGLPLFLNLLIHLSILMTNAILVDGLNR